MDSTVFSRTATGSGLYSRHPRKGHWIEEVELEEDRLRGYSRAVPLVRPLIVLIAALSLFAAFAGIASANKAVDSYCSPTGDWCQGVFREGGHIKFRIDTFSFRGPYKLCVKPPKEPRECRTFKLVHKSGGIYGSKIDFARNFSHRRNGRYAVSWHQEGFHIGPKLHFSKR